MLPRKKYTSNARSFYTPDGKMALGKGLDVYRGHFQSLRPSIGRLLINVDVTSAVFYRSGPLAPVCMDILGMPLQELNTPARAFSDANKRRLESFLRTVKVVTTHTGKARTHAIQGLVQPASATFNHQEFGKITIANYFKRQYNITLRNPAFPCVKVRLLRFRASVLSLNTGAGGEGREDTHGTL